MKALIIAICFYFLMTRVYSMHHILPIDMNDSLESPSDQVEEFFKLLQALSRYNAPDYSDSLNEKPNYDSYFDNIGSANHLSQRSYKTWTKSDNDQPNQQDQLNQEEPAHQANQEEAVNQKDQLDPENQVIKKDQHLENAVSKEQSTTPEPDLLASMPPVTPNKGQKEYVMLRPPSDNHRKIEKWMQTMANSMLFDRHLIQKRNSMKMQSV